MSKNLLPMFSSRNFMALVLKFSLQSILSWFFYMVERVVQSDSFSCSTIYCRGCLFIIAYSCMKIRVGFWAPYSVPLIYVSLFCQYCTVLTTVQISSKSGIWYPQLCSSFSRLFWIFRVFGVSTNAIDILIGIPLICRLPWVVWSF